MATAKRVSFAYSLVPEDLLYATSCRVVEYNFSRFERSNWKFSNIVRRYANFLNKVTRGHDKSTMCAEQPALADSGLLETYPVPILERTIS